MSDFADFVAQLNSVIKESSNNTENSNETTTNVNASTKPVDSSNNIGNNTGNTKLSILIVSTHVNQVNGYSKVIHNIIKELAKNEWIKIIHYGTQKLVNADLGRKYPLGVKVIDASSLEKQKQTGFAFNELPSVINNEKPDIVLIYNDLSIICSYIEEIRKQCQDRFFKIWAYADITYANPPQQMIDILNRDVERIFCFTKTWKDELKSRGITRPVDVMNHGIDGKLLRSIPRELARQSLGLPKDFFLFTSLNKNIPRKRLDLLIMGFARFIVRFPLKNFFMLVVADVGGRGGYPLFDIFSRELKLNGANTETFGNRLLVTSKETCYKDEDINMLYNCGDVGVSCAEGEGFGLCTFEQMAIGIPQIVPEINGYTEYCNDKNSILVKPKTRYYIPQSVNIVTGEAHMVDPEDVAKAMELYAFNENLRNLHGKHAKETVSTYTWEKCCEGLIKRLKTAVEDKDD